MASGLEGVENEAEIFMDFNEDKMRINEKEFGKIYDSIGIKVEADGKVIN